VRARRGAPGARGPAAALQSWWEGAPPRPAAAPGPLRASAQSALTGCGRRRAEEHTARLSAEAQAADASRRLVVAQEQARAAPAPAGRPAQAGKAAPEGCAAQESPRQGAGGLPLGR